MRSTLKGQKGMVAPHISPKIQSHKNLIGLKDLMYIIELVILSTWIKNADPLSLTISAKVVAGKTELLKQYRKIRGVKFLSEPTAYGIKIKYLVRI
jgi:hypothetical protein